MPKFFSAILVLLFLPGFGFSSQENDAQSKEQEEVSTNEDLMREHGILNRLLLIYQEIADRIDNNQPFPLVSLTESSHLVRNFL